MATNSSRSSARLDSRGSPRLPPLPLVLVVMLALLVGVSLAIGTIPMVAVVLVVVLGPAAAAEPPGQQD